MKEELIKKIKELKKPLIYVNKQVSQTFSEYYNEALEDVIKMIKNSGYCNEHLLDNFNYNPMTPKDVIAQAEKRFDELFVDKSESVDKVNWSANPIKNFIRSLLQDLEKSVREYETNASTDGLENTLTEQNIKKLIHISCDLRQNKVVEDILKEINKRKV